MSLLLAGCQLIGGIEVRDEYVAPGAGGDSSGNGGTRPKAGSGGDDARGGSSANAGAGVVEGGAAGAPSTGGAAGEADAGAGGVAPEPPVVCGDGNAERGEACDDGAQNGETDKCDDSCGFVCDGACPLRVDPTITTPGDGTTWETALGSLQAAVTQQQAAGGGEVWVKQATITASQAGVMLNLGSSVAIYGGFQGTELRLAQRPTPTEATVTVLDAAAMAYPAVRGAGGATLDGFLIKGATGAGGSAFTATSVTDLRLRHVWFKGNAGVGGCGGALVLNGGEARLEACHFEGNTSDGVGGAICLEYTVSTLHIDGSFFVDNEAAGNGGAIHAYGSYSPVRIPAIHVTGSTFINNRTTTMQTHGGAIYVANAKFDVTDSDFMSNSSALGEGAAVYCDTDTDCPIVNSTFVHNRGFRAAVAGNTPNMKVVNSTFAFNDSGCPDICDVSSKASLLLQNSVLVQSEKIYMQSTSGVTSSNNCSIFISGGLGSKPSPFVEPLVDADGNGVPEYLLAQPADNGCLNIGNDANAAAAGVDWATLTTSANNCLDASPVDAGRHYAPTKANTKTCE